MAYEGWLVLIEFTEQLLYLLIAFMCGLIIGYITGFNGD
jgi:hypothetical protein